MSTFSRVAGYIFASLIAAVMVFSVLYQFFQLTFGDVHAGSMYGGRGSSYMSDSY